VSGRSDGSFAPAGSARARPRGGESLVGGLLSGTSMDGIDAILLRVEGDDPEALAWEVVGFHTVPWGEEEREGMQRAMATGGADARGLASLHVALGQGFADAFLQLLQATGTPPDQVEAVGSHGQTIWHEPPSGGRRGWTLQLGDAATLAERTGVPVVHDFRARDMAAGGQGAPLVPWADRVLLHRPGVGRALQNLGGMGNVTFLPASGAWDEIVAFDTGPGVALVDAAFRRAQALLPEPAHGGAPPPLLPFDVDGRRAARGRVDETLLATLLADAFFDAPPPRSTGRERFGEARLTALLSDPASGLRGRDPEAWDDLLATLVELTARSVARAYREHLPVEAIHRVVLAGGGARNPTLVRAIEAALTREIGPRPVDTGAGALGIDPDAREAAAFALLAWAHLRGIPGSLPRVTGATGPRVLGSFVPGATG